MAFPSIPTNLIVQQANRHVLVQFDLIAGATSYSIQRSTDGVNYTVIATPTTNSYLDSTVLVGVEYWYQVASTNTSGTSPYCAPIAVVPAPTAELSLLELRQRAQQKADRVNSNFVTTDEWNFFINQAMYELYDTLIDVYEDYFMATPAQFMTDGTTYLYNLPDGATSFINLNQQSYIAPPFYKLAGVDLGINSAGNAWVTVNKFNFIDRNRFVYPNTASTIYGIFNLQYRMVGNQLLMIPTPTANQPVRLWYYPRLPALLKDTDLTTIGYSGWLQYVIVRAAKYALDKEESDTSKLDQELSVLNSRIEETSQNRDAGQPDKISDVRQNGQWNPNGSIGYNGPNGGY